MIQHPLNTNTLNSLGVMTHRGDDRKERKTK